MSSRHRVGPTGLVLVGATLVVMLGACGGGPVVTPAPAPEPAPVVVEPVRAPTRVMLPSRMARTTWQVTTRARISASAETRGDTRGDARGDTRSTSSIDSRALVSWTLERAANGALRGTGQVDSFTVRSTLDSVGNLTNNPTNRSTNTPTNTPTNSAMASPANNNRPPGLLLLDAVVDSVSHRVVTRPLLPNECDRPELSAVALAKDVLVRIPDGLAVGDRWRDSTVSLVCRTGVPITIHTVTQSVVERLDQDRLLINRTITATLDGKGGSAFRGFELTGTSSGTQRLRVHPVSGVLETIDGTSTLTLQVTERTPSGIPRTQHVVQQMELKAERVAR